MLQYVLIVQVIGLTRLRFELLPFCKVNSHSYQSSHPVQLRHAVGLEKKE